MVEKGSPPGRQRYARLAGAVLGMRRFGMSTSMKVVSGYFGFTTNGIIAAARGAASVQAMGLTR
jgi:transketolase